MPIKSIEKKKIGGMNWVKTTRSKRKPSLRRSNAKDLDKLENQVLALIYEGLDKKILGLSNGVSYYSNRVSKEGLSHTLNVPEHQVHQVLQRLNLKGLLSQKRNFAPHDSRRDHFCPGSGSAWMPSYHVLYIDKINDYRKNQKTS